MPSRPVTRSTTARRVARRVRQIHGLANVPPVSADKVGAMHQFSDDAATLVLRASGAIAKMPRHWTSNGEFLATKRGVCTVRSVRSVRSVQGDGDGDGDDGDDGDTMVLVLGHAAVRAICPWLVDSFRGVSDLGEMNRNYFFESLQQATGLLLMPTNIRQLRSRLVLAAFPPPSVVVFRRRFDLSGVAFDHFVMDAVWSSSRGIGLGYTMFCQLVWLAEKTKVPHIVLGAISPDLVNVYRRWGFEPLFSPHTQNQEEVIKFTRTHVDGLAAADLGVDLFPMVYSVFA